MSLKTEQLATALKDAFTSLQNKENNKLDTTETLSKAIASAIETFVKSGEVEVIADTGKIVVVGGPATQNNPAPVIIKGKVS